MMNLFEQLHKNNILSVNTKHLDFSTDHSPGGYSIVDQDNDTLQEIESKLQFDAQHEVSSLMEDHITGRNIVLGDNNLKTTHSFKIMATNDYKEGDVIITEPYLILSKEPITSYSTPGFIEFLQYNLTLDEKALKAISLIMPYRHVLLGEFDMNKSEALMRTLKLNCFHVDQGFALYYILSFLNHSCNPNCFYEYDNLTKNGKIIAFSDIKAGDELTISYVAGTSIISGLSQAEEFMDNYKITCMCGQCQNVSQEKLVAMQFKYMTHLKNTNHPMLKLLRERLEKYSCLNCGETENLKKCSGCKMCYYCNQECQATHWKEGHKFWCKHMATLKNYL